MEVAIRHVLLDMDGVVADFTAAAVALFGREWPPQDRNLWGESLWNIPAYLDVSAEEFVARIDAEGSEFWQRLPWTPDGDALLATVLERFPREAVHLASSGYSCREYTYVGKSRWVGREMAEWLGRFTFTQEKHLMANRRHLLIDDSGSNVRRFVSAGGHAILVPRPWNALYAIPDAVVRVRDRLKHYRYEADPCI